MQDFSLTNIYSALMHLLGLGAVTALTATGTIPATEGVPLIAGIIGLGIGVGVSPSTPGAPPAPVVPQATSTTATGATPAPVPTATTAIVAPSGASIILTPEQSHALASPPAG